MVLIKNNHSFKVFEGLSPFTGKAIFQLIGLDSEFAGEWHDTKEEAENELKNV